PDIAFARIAQRAIGQSLPAPIERGDRKAAGAQIAHGLEIFLDELGAALKQAYGALAPRRRRPPCEAQRDAVGSLQGSGHHVLGDRIGWDRDEIHDQWEAARPRQGGACWPYISTA